jgi:hypothetical protein
VVRTTDVARRWCCDLFAAYVGPGEMPADFARPSPTGHRAVADYVAGMTDRFALREYRRLTGQDLFGASTARPTERWRPADATAMAGATALPGR